MGPALTHFGFKTKRRTGSGGPRRGVRLALAGLGLLCLLAAGRLGASPYGIGLAAAGAAMLAALAVSGLAGAIRRARRWRGSARAADLVEHDAAASLVADDLGRVVARNAAARDRFPPHDPDTIGAVLQQVYAQPGAVTARLQDHARAAGNASEDIVTRHGHLRLQVHRLPGEGFLWRVEDAGQGPARGHGGTGMPMLTVGRGNAILFMNDAARDFVGERVRSLDSVFPELPPKSGGFSLALSRDGPRRCLVHEVESKAGRRELFFLPVSPEADCNDPGEAAFDALPVAVLRLDRDGAVLRSNRVARGLLSIGTGDGAALPQLVEGPGRPIAGWLAEAAEGRGPKRSEFLRVKRGEAERFVQITLNRAQEAHGDVLIAVLQDATEMMSLEAQFAQSQKMQAIGELAGGIAHDFNNLLTAITGYCDLLMLRHEESDPDYADLVQISQTANRAAALVGQLLAFSRKQTRRPEPIDIRDTLADLGHLLNRLVGEKIDLVLQQEASPWRILADKRQLEQVLMNLVVNARDAMPGGGEIRIETANETLAEPMRRDGVTVPAGDYLRLLVTDQGSGIAPDKLDKVFQPFFTTKRSGEGTGLGLSTVYGIVKQSGGYVFVDSTLGEGTCFTLLFPVCTGAALEPAAPETEAPKPVLNGDGVVLLVEDEAPVRAFAARALRLRGYTVIEAANAEEALDLLQDPDLTVHLFVTDVIMPGLNGPDWVRAALKTRPGVRVIFVSGYAEDALEDGEGDIPGSVYLPKPFSLNDLIETVQRQLR